MRSDEYYTPKWAYAGLGPFDLDPCAGPVSKITRMNYRIDSGQDGLSWAWFGFVWLNPPFSQKEKWISKMKAHGNGFLLLPGATSTPWFNPLAEYCGGVFLYGKKINFINSPSSNTGGNALFPFGDQARQSLIDNTDIPGSYYECKTYVPRETKQISLFL